MSREDFEKRLKFQPPYIRNIYKEYRNVFSDDLVSLHWYPGWSHIVEGLLRKVSEDPECKIAKIKSHFSHLYIHYYSTGEKHDYLLESVNYYCSRSCKHCGNLINLGDMYCEYCEDK